MSPAGGRRFKIARLNASRQCPVASVEAQDQAPIYRL
jgi:hypothetical protein